MESSDYTGTEEYLFVQWTFRVKEGTSEYVDGPFMLQRINYSIGVRLYRKGLGSSYSKTA